MSRQVDVVLFGSFGFGNVGDEAVPLAIEDLFAGAGVRCNLEVVARWDRPRESGVIGLAEENDERLKSLSERPVILSGGGVIENKEICCLSRYDIYRKKVCPKKSAIVAGSFEFGVNYSWRTKRILRKQLSLLECVYTRDYISEIFIRETFPEFEVSTLGDIVLGLRAESFSYSRLAGQPYIAVSLAKVWDDSPGWYNWIALELKVLSDELDCPILFTPMSCSKEDDDRRVHRAISAKIISLGARHEPVEISAPLNPREIAGVFKDAKLVVAMRLHGCVMSYGQRTPFVGLSYHPKLIGFAQTVGWRHFLLPKCSNIRQDSARYGISFDEQKFERNSLIDSAQDALESGSFELLPLFVRDLTNALLNFTERKTS